LKGSGGEEVEGEREREERRNDAKALASKKTGHKDELTPLFSPSQPIRLIPQ